MATTKSSETKAAEAKAATSTPPADPDEAAQDAREQAAGARRRQREAAGECVVDDGRPHVGRAVNGVVCSAHAVHYTRDGRRRGQ